MAVPSASRFPQTRTLEPHYDHVIPSRRNRGAEVKKFEKILLESSIKGSSNIGRYPITLPLPPYHPLTPSPPSQASSNNAEWSGNIENLKTRLANQISSLQRSIHLHEQYLDEATPTLTALVLAAKESPSQTARVISCHGDETTPTLEEYKGRDTVQCGATRGCTQQALPFSRCCLQHVNKDEEQVLYRSCIALNTSTMAQCSHPVTDVLAKDSICAKHTKSSLQVSDGGTAQKPRAKRPKLTFARTKVAKMVAAQRARNRRGGAGPRAKPKAGKKAAEVLVGGATQSVSVVSMATGVEEQSCPNKDVSNLSSSSWSSGESDEEEPPVVATTTNDASGREPQQQQAGPASLDDLPTLTPSQVPPLPPLQLVPPVFADLDAMMMDEDSNSDNGGGGGDSEQTT